VAWTVSFDAAWPRRIVRRIDGVRVPYLSRADLIASKQTGRPADRADIEQLAPREQRRVETRPRRRHR